MKGVERKTTVGIPKEEACSIAIVARFTIDSLDSNWSRDTTPIQGSGRITISPVSFNRMGASRYFWIRLNVLSIAVFGAYGNKTDRWVRSQRPTISRPRNSLLRVSVTLDIARS